MGFKSVYQCLIEVFPQVDSRLLKAVAIEHSKDAPTAVEIVLSEVLPFLERQSVISSPPFEDHSQSGLSDGGDEHEVQTNLLRRRRVHLGKTVASSSETDDATETDCAADLHHVDSTCQEKPLKASTSDTHVDTNQVQGNVENEEVILLGNTQCQEDKSTLTSKVISNASVHEDNADHSQVCVNTESEVMGQCHDNITEVGHEQIPEIVSANLIPESVGSKCTVTGHCSEWKDFVAPTADDFDIVIRGNSPQVESCLDGIASEVVSANLTQENIGCNCSLTGHSERKDFDAPLADDFDTVIHGKSPEVESCLDGIASEVVSANLSGENVGFNGSLTGHHNEWKDFDASAAKDFDASAAKDFDTVIHGKSPQVESCLDGIALELENSVVEQASIAAECGLHSEFSGSPISDCENAMSKQDIKIDLLDEFVEAAKNNKKTLFSAMESVMTTMRQVELQEKAAEQAKEEAARGGLDVLVQVEELKKMLAHAREANDMHAGEVYGEKAILATEVRELQARLLSLSDERDNALAILEEMRQTLEVRLAAAEELRKAAEQEKLEKEESAGNALAEQGIIMEKVVLESKLLQQEAEENSKLREFLMDRGHVVDTLQGEISVICLDVRLLKEKFDERLPLSESISSSQTSCILASSGSSLKSMASDLVCELGETSKSPKETGPSSSFDGQSPKSKHEDERTIDNRKELLDDGWDFFENDSEM